MANGDQQQQPSFVTVTKGDGKFFDIDPGLLKGAVAKGYRVSGHDEQYAQKPSFGEQLTAGYNPKTENMNPVVKGLDAAGGAALGFLPSLYHAYADKPTPEEQQTYAGHKEVQPGSVAGRAMLGTERLFGRPVIDAAKAYANPNTRPSLQTIKELGPQALGTGVGTVGAAEALDMGTRGAIDRIKGGKYSDVLQELEKYRKTVNKAPSKVKDVRAREIHAALLERMDHEWTELYKGLQDTPTDALAITKAMEKLAKADPVYAKWLEDNIVESKSGQSVTMPLFMRVRELSKEMNRDLANPKLDRTVRVEIEQAHSKLEDILKEAADREGLKQRYERAYRLNRSVNNIKHHEAWTHQPVRQSPLWGLGGAVLGAGLIGKLGIDSELVGLIVGREGGKMMGEAATPTGRFRTSDLARKGEAEVWKQFGEDAPKGTMKKVHKSGEITHYDAPKAQSAKVAKMGKAKTPVSGGSQGADPWQNIKYDKAATEQAVAEQKAGKLPQGMSVVQRAQQIKEELMSKGVKGSFATGTDHVPETGKYQLHKGEAVVPAAQASHPLVRAFLNLINPMSAIGSQYSRNTDSQSGAPRQQVPGIEHAMNLFRQYGDTTSAAGMSGVRPIKHPVTSIDILPMPNPVNPMGPPLRPQPPIQAPMQSPNFGPKPGDSGVI